MSDTQARIGYVISASGGQATLALSDFHTQTSKTPTSGNVAGASDERARIGSLVRMRTPGSAIFGLITRLSTDVKPGPNGPVERHMADIDLLGEIMDGGGATGSFERGVSMMPSLGTEVVPASGDDIGRVYAQPTTQNVQVGSIHQDAKTPAYLMVDNLLAKHFAVLGTTGSGKSCAVALILRKILTAHPAGHVILLDPHNEYRSAFGDLAEFIEPENLLLPCWLLNSEEISSMMVRGGDASDQTAQTALLNEAILEAKKRFASNKEDTAHFNTDTPVPYRLTELIQILKDGMGKLDKPDGSTPYLRLLARLSVLNADKRFAFMFSGVLVRDTMPHVLSRILRIPVSGKPLTIVDLSGVPSEIVDVVVSVIARMVFDFAVWAEPSDRPPLLLVCEEAHRYIPIDDQRTFQATKSALSRIAREGRKYGVSLGLISQRPSELEPSVVSQCGTLFALRMNNTMDQSFVEAAMPENGLGLMTALPALRRQEAIVVGEGVTVPMRLRFDTLKNDDLPRSGDAAFADSWTQETGTPAFLLDAVDRWRRQQR